MNGKETAKKRWMKIGFGILFVAACFIAMYILMEFHGDKLMVGIAAVLLLVSAFLFMNAVFSDKAKKWIPQEEEPEEVVAVSSSGDGEFRLKITKHMKEMENFQKELIDVVKAQNTMIQGQIENLEHEIYMLSEKQVNQSKAVIKYNKENARQLAISERETLEYVLYELKKTIKEKGGSTVSELEELAEEDLFTVSNLASDDEFVMPAAEETPVVSAPVDEVPAEAPAAEEPVAEPAAESVAEAAVTEELEIPEIPEDIDLSELFDIPELFDEPAEAAPETVEPEAEATAEEPAPVPAADPLAGLTNDPNAMMTPEDIAKLLEAMGQ